MLTANEIKTIQEYLQWRIEKPLCEDCAISYGVKDPPCGRCLSVLPEKLEKLMTLYDLVMSYKILELDDVMYSLMEVHSLQLELENMNLFNPKVIGEE